MIVFVEIRSHKKYYSYFSWFNGIYFPLIATQFHPFQDISTITSVDLVLFLTDICVHGMWQGLKR